MTARRAVVLSAGKRPEHPADPGMLAAIFRAAELECGHAECACCGKFLGIRPGIPLGQVSHGVCAPLCREARALGYGEYFRDGGDNATPSSGIGGPATPGDCPSESAPVPASVSVVGHGWPAARVFGSSPVSPVSFSREVAR